MYEVFEHTADLGLRVTAASLDALFAEAAEGLFSLIVTDPASIRPERRMEFWLPAQPPDFLLVDWLSELLFVFESQRLLLRDFQVHIDPAMGLSGSAWGEPLDAARHQLEHEVKAVTYHGLKVGQSDAGWKAEVILDI